MALAAAEAAVYVTDKSSLLAVTANHRCFIQTPIIHIPSIFVHIIRLNRNTLFGLLFI